MVEYCNNNNDRSSINILDSKTVNNKMKYSAPISGGGILQ
jgi:hypothetical protein